MSTKNNPAQPTFNSPLHRERYEHLLGRKFGYIHTIDWEALRVADLADEVQQFLSVVLWIRIFGITNPVYHELTLEVLATFEKKKGEVSWHIPDVISFQLLGSIMF